LKEKSIKPQATSSKLQALTALKFFFPKIQTFLLTHRFKLQAASLKPQAASFKRQAASDKLLDNFSLI
jgi:hypothetical protein